MVDKLQIVKDVYDTTARLVISLALLYFAYKMEVDREATTLSTAIATGVLAGWLQQQVAKQAEKQAEKLQEAVSAAGNGKTHKVNQMDVETEELNVRSQH